RYRRAFEAGDLLKISKLGDLHAVAPAFPAQAPGAEGRAFPIVLDEADVVEIRVDPDRVERLEIEVLEIGRVRFEDYLELIIILKPVWILAIAAVFRPPRRLHVSGIPRLGPERAQSRRRMKRAGADLHVVGLKNDAAPIRPVSLQGKNQPLKR